MTPSPEAPVRFAVRVDGIDVDTGTLRYTNVQVFFNEEADRAAKEDGQPGGAPNPIWIRDLHTTGALPIDPAATVTMLGFDAEGSRVPKSATVAVFVRVFTVGAPANEWDSGPLLFVEVVDGRIVTIEQVATP